MSKKNSQSKSAGCPKAKLETLESSKDFQKLIQDWKQIPNEVARAERVAGVLSGSLKRGYQSCMASLLGVTEGTIRRYVAINALNDVDKKEIGNGKSAGPILKRAKLRTGSAIEVPAAESSSKQHQNEDSTPAAIGTECSSLDNDKTVSKSVPPAPPAGKNDVHEEDYTKARSLPEHSDGINVFREGPSPKGEAVKNLQQIINKQHEDTDRYLESNKASKGTILELRRVSRIM